MKRQSLGVRSAVCQALLLGAVCVLTAEAQPAPVPYTTRDGRVSFDVPRGLRVFETDVVLSAPTHVPVKVLRLTPEALSEVEALGTVPVIDVKAEALEGGEDVAAFAERRSIQRKDFQRVSRLAMSVDGGDAVRQTSRDNGGQELHEVFATRHGRGYRFTSLGSPHSTAVFEAFLESVVFAAPKESPARPSPEAEELASAKTVRTYYLVPTDKVSRLDYKRATEGAVRHFQAWLPGALGVAKTYVTPTPAVATIGTNHDSAHYSTSPRSDSDPVWWFFWNVWFEGLSLTGGFPNEPDNRRVFYIDAFASCADPHQYGGAAAQGAVVMDGHDLRGLNGEEYLLCHADETPGVCRWVGGFGHELSHTLGLPERDDASLMGPGVRSYPATYYNPTDRGTVAASPFVVPFTPPGAESGFGCPPPELSIGDASVVEGDQGSTDMAFQVTLSRSMGQTVTASYETVDGSAVASSGDYTATSGTLTFPPGTRDQTITVAVLGDRVDEGVERFYVRLIGSNIAVPRDGEAAGSIEDNDPPPRISTQDNNTMLEGSSGGTGPLRYQLQLDRPSAFEVRVTLRTEDVTARAGADYLARNETLIFTPGQTSWNKSIFVIGDRLYEPGPDETFWVKLENPVNATVDAPRPEGWRGVIVDDDPVPTVSVADCTRVEGNSGSGPCAFTVSLSNPSTQTMSVSYATAGQTAGAGTDFQDAFGTLSFPPETINRTVEVAITGDVEPEWNESFLIHLSSPTTGITDGDGVGTIVDDERARFHAVTQCRVLDTRQPDGASGGPILPAGNPRSFPIAGVCGVPGTAKAVVVNVTTTVQSTAGSLRLYPAGLPAPDTSVLNFAANTARANNATVLLGTAGQITVLADLTGGGQTHVIVDVFGYYRGIVGVDPARGVASSVTGN